MDIEQEISNIKNDIHEIRERQLTYVGKHHDMDKELVAIQTELGYMREDVKAIQAGINKLIWTVGAAMIVAIVGFILQGGLVL